MLLLQNEDLEGIFNTIRMRPGLEMFPPRQVEGLRQHDVRTVRSEENQVQ